MFKFTFLVPTTLNDGTAVPQSYLAGVAADLAMLCGGSSTDGSSVHGIWFGSGGQQFNDTNRRYSAAAERSQLNDLIALVERIGRDLKQEAMFFEVIGYDGPQIITIT